jgi:ABC-type glutathione transport system ATPase component
LKPANLIEIDHVTFGYDVSRTILDDVSLAFERGKVTAILGGSGSGKTTLLRLIGGLISANQGRVLFDGETVNSRDREQLYRLRRRRRADAADPAPPVRWRRPPGGEAAAGRCGGVPRQPWRILGLINP